MYKEVTVRIFNSLKIGLHDVLLLTQYTWKHINEECSGGVPVFIKSLYNCVNTIQWKQISLEWNMG
jgi:hypothetical protein